MSMKNSKIETATFRLVAQCLQQLRYRVPRTSHADVLICHWDTANILVSTDTALCALKERLQDVWMVWICNTHQRREQKFSLQT
jgi:hypothetical protein